MKRKTLFLILIIAVAVILIGYIVKQTFEPKGEEIDLTNSHFYLSDFVNSNFLKGKGTNNEKSIGCSIEYYFEQDSYDIIVKKSAKCSAGNQDWFEETFIINSDDKSVFKTDEFPVLNCNSFNYTLEKEQVESSFSIERSKTQTKLVIGSSGFTAYHLSKEELYNQMIVNIKQNFVDCNTPISEE